MPISSEGRVDPQEVLRPVDHRLRRHHRRRLRFTLADIEAKGAAIDNAERATTFKRDAAVTPDQLVTPFHLHVGNDGNPKGVMLTQDNLYSNVIATKSTLHVSTSDLRSASQAAQSYLRAHRRLPLFSNGVRIAYAESIDTVPVNMSEGSRR
jgi:long-chain acyl-CoA synthetase